QKVTSKGGTTYAALRSFEAHGVADAIGAGVAACVARSQELAEQLAE
ncbi:pyrroline-5-carboxylate reductase dimerization domain-containing protein, partial [Eikenella corrodens]|nr:pyrroline-5-carboxylate reductase dimerization domain-containing protein [Eikenella corrodens]